MEVAFIKQGSFIGEDEWNYFFTTVNVSIISFTINPVLLKPASDCIGAFIVKTLSPVIVDAKS